MDSSIISIIIVLITMGLFVWNRLPISVVAILGSVAMAMFIPEMDLSAVYSGFSATGWPMVVGMCVVSAALFETGIARKIGEKSEILFSCQDGEAVYSNGKCCVFIDVSIYE